LGDRALIITGLAGGVLAAICCVAPLLAAVLPLAAFGALLAGAGLAAIPLMLTAGLVFIAWRHHHRPVKPTGCGPATHRKDARP
jgi:mercuric ion transport protein